MMVVFILNRSPTHVVDGKTPFEACHGEAPTVHFFRTFGCNTHVKNMHPGLKKLNDRSHKTIFVGYESRLKAYRCYDPIEQHVIMLQDVIFDEAGMWCWQADGEDSALDSEPLTV
jgi:hypothetical protein